MPGFDPRSDADRDMGAIPELVRTMAGRPPQRRTRSCRSPRSAPHAEEITAGHALDSGFGERSPVARVRDRDGDVLLLGAGHGSNSSLHLAEHHVPDPPRETSSAALMTPEGRRWVTWEDVVANERGLRGARRRVRRDRPDARRAGRRGQARLMRQRELLEFAVGWMAENRRRD